jgi:hypothetical protein
MPAPLPRRRQPPRPYCEAYPKIDILDLEAQLRRGAVACEWTNEKGAIAGHISDIVLGSESVSFSYKFLGITNIEASHGNTRTALTWINRNGIHNRPAIVCPSCATQREVIYFVSRKWACRVCHDLGILSSLLSPVSRKVRERWQLTQALSAGRPRHMRRERYTALRQRLRALDRELGPEPAQPLAPDWSFEMRPTWHSSNDQLMFEPDYTNEAYGWKPLALEGFDRYRQEARRQLEAQTGVPARGGAT